MITIYGASDDLVEVEGCKGAGEFCTDDWQGELVAPDGSQMRVYARYDAAGAGRSAPARSTKSTSCPAGPSPSRRPRR